MLFLKKINKITILLPSENIKFLILKNNKKYYIYIYNMFFYIFFEIQKNNMFVGRYLRFFEININNFSKDYERVMLLLNDLIYSWEFYFFKKIKFLGKMYQIKKSNKKNLIKLNFGHSHKTIFNILNCLNNKKKKKYCFFLKKKKHYNKVF